MEMYKHVVAFFYNTLYIYTWLKVVFEWHKFLHIMLCRCLLSNPIKKQKKDVSNLTHLFRSVLCYFVRLLVHVCHVESYGVLELSFIIKLLKVSY